MSSMLFAADEKKSTAGQTQTAIRLRRSFSDRRRQQACAPDMGSLAMQRMLGRGMTISCCRVSCGGEEVEVV